LASPPRRIFSREGAKPQRIINPPFFAPYLLCESYFFLLAKAPSLPTAGYLSLVEFIFY
jgi:hypothetical protein